MKPILIIGTIIVIFALIFYTIGIYTEQKKKVINRKVLRFLSLGLLFDISATICMIIGSTNSPFTFHGFIGYTGLLAMTLETISAYRFHSANGPTAEVSKQLHLYSRFAYFLWVLVFITGAFIAAF